MGIAQGVDIFFFSLKPFSFGSWSPGPLWLTERLKTKIKGMWKYFTLGLCSFSFTKCREFVWYISEMNHFNFSCHYTQVCKFNISSPSYFFHDLASWNNKAYLFFFWYISPLTLIIKPNQFYFLLKKKFDI